MKSLRNKLLFWFLILLPTAWVFKYVLFGNLPTWGDAPHFYSEGLKELFSEPLVWVERGTFLGGINSFLWLSPTMLLFGLFNKFLSLESDILVRIFFYFPSLFLAAIGSYFLVKYLKLSRITQFFAVLVYLLNTYYLLLIDGGQVGVALAYGLFPLVILFARKVLDKLGINSFFYFLIASFLLSIIDPRVFLVAFLLLIIWQILDNWKRLWVLVLAGSVLIPLNFYWLHPLIRLDGTGLSLGRLNLQLSSLLNSLLLYAPHWPGNIFGKVMQPSFYFALIPILVFGSLLSRQRTKLFPILSFCFLVFAFLAKGSLPPLGGWYDFAVSKLSFGFAFRDSTKFFIPLMILGGILIGETINNLQTKFNSKVLLCFVYGYVFFLIAPAFLGKLNFNLSDRKAGNDFWIIYDHLKKDDTFFRTLWFPEKHPLAFETLAKPALSAEELVTKRPFTAMNTSEDVFNFLNNPNYISWLRILGVKYLVLSGNSRDIYPSENETKDWQTILTLIDQTPGLQKLNWGTNIPIYEISGPLPKTYVVEKLVAVVGPELESETESLIPAIFFEDGQFKPELLNGKNENSVKILFNDKEKLDLTLSFLQKYFQSPKESISSEWAVYDSTEILKTKYELLIRSYNYRDFDYGKGLAFSTKKGEKIKFRFRISKDGDYILAKRIGNEEKQSLFWLVEERRFKKGNFETEIENGSTLGVLNVVALVPKEEFKKAEHSTEVFLKHFGVVTKEELSSIDRAETTLKKEGSLKYKFTPSKEGYWFIFNESFSPVWKLRKGADYFEPVPVYSSVNGFYFDPKWEDLHLEYKGQETFRFGVWVSSVTLLFLLIIYFYLHIKKDEGK